MCKLQKTVKTVDDFAQIIIKQNVKMLLKNKIKSCDNFTTFFILNYIVSIQLLI